MFAADGLGIVFDPALDGGGWPGPLRDRAAVLGEAWLGPLGLLDRLELELGLLARHATATERVADLSRRLAGQDGFWRRSYEADPIGTSRRLLADRGTLALWGWRGEPASERLAALWNATSDALPGVADRLRRITEVLPRRRLDIAQIRVFEPTDTLAPLWRQLFQALGNAGVVIDETPLATAPATGDLAAARAAAFAPIGDGSLQLVRSHGPLAAADEVASALAALADLRGLVLIGADAILDDAMVRHGLPRTGAEVAAPGSSALVRLVVETAFSPMSPADLHALLTIDPGPVPRGIANRLVGALRELPSRGAPSWRAALDQGLERYEPGEREALRLRLATLLEPVTTRGEALRLEQLSARMRTLTTWARGRLPGDASLSELITFAEGLLALARTMGAVEITRADARRMCDEVDRRWIAGPPAEAGVARIPRPGAMLGAARVVVWWGFTRDLAPAPPRLRLSERERAALRAAGVAPPDAGAEMAAEARRWRRALLQATEALVLVCPRHDEASQAAHPHPLWDELRASMREPSLAARLQLAAPGLPLVAQLEQATLRPPPRATTTVQVLGPVSVRGKESPSSLEKLLGCSLAWTMDYLGRLRRGLSVGPAEPSPPLFGSLAHHLLAQIFADGAMSADAAAARAEALVDHGLADLAEALSLPEHQVERSMVRRAVIDSAREVGRLLTASGATVRGVEVDLERVFDQVTIGGRADLLLSGPDVVIDYKWGGSSPRDRLKSGAAIQLAIYAELARTGEAMPGIAYLGLRDQRFMAAPGTSLSDAQAVGMHDAGTMWRATLTAVQARLRQLGTGALDAPGATGEKLDPSALDRAGMMRIEAPCGYCELAGLCGRRGGA